MKILAVEFSSEERSVAVIETRETGPVILGRACELGGRRAIELVEQALSDSKCEREEIGCIAVGVGPGSYTGIRGSISLAQGWQLGRDVKIIGISSAECMAARYLTEKGAGEINIAIDAQKNEFYLCRWKVSAGILQEVEPLRLVSAVQVEELCRAGGIVLGPDVSKRFCGAKDIFPDAGNLGILAAKRTDFIPGERIEPIYLRTTDFKKAPPIRVIS